MLIRVNGASAGICKYLAEGIKSGRSHSRDELDNRVVLSGDLELLDSTLNMFDKHGEHQKYLHITLSFKEQDISEQDLREIDSQFKSFIFSACHEDEFCYYSEAQYPKIKFLRDKDGNKYERFPHIHVVIPQFNLMTGKREQFLGKVENITHYINAFQETINYKYGLASPKDNFREISGGREEVLNRHKINPDMSRKKIKQEIAQIVKLDKTIRSVDELALVLRSFGVVTVRDSKKFGGKYINLKLHNQEKAINLKDSIFLDGYLSTRNPQFIGQQEQEERNKIIFQWQEQAQKIRFVDRCSPKVREAYKQMTEDEKRNYLKKVMARHLKKIPTLEESIEPVIVEPSAEIKATELYIHREKGNVSREKQYGRIATISNKANSSEWTAKINAVDMRFLLNYLGYHYGIDTEKIKIVRTKNGYERFKVDNRMYSASDFMAKHLYLNWHEIRKHIDSVIEKQDKEVQRANQVNSQLLWHHFQRYEENLEGLSGLKSKLRDARADIFSRTEFTYDSSQTKAQNYARQRLLRQQYKAEMQGALDAFYKAREYYLQSPDERYLQWLHQQAMKGDKTALDELNRVYPTYEKDNSLSFVNKVRRKTLFSPFELGFKVNINKRGQIEYHNDDNEAVIIDARNSIRVKSRDADTIAKALRLAQQRFGVDGFEIANATEKDKQAIQQAVNKVKVNVTVFPSKGVAKIEKER